MDLSMLSTVQHSGCDDTLATYDVMCRYIIFLPDRVLKYPENFRPHFFGTSFVGLIPKFHLPAHQEKCRISFNLNYAKRVGRTNGEGVERNWSVTNALASSTKYMGPGSRSNTLDDHFGFANWRKRTLFRKSYSILISTTLC
jgi:hypothetical protein